VGGCGKWKVGKKEPPTKGDHCIIEGKQAKSWNGDLQTETTKRRGMRKHAGLQTKPAWGEKKRSCGAEKRKNQGQMKGKR